MDRKATLSPSKRLKMGATILAGAQVTDVKPVQERLDAFASAHRNYYDAHIKVCEADAALRTTQARVLQLDVEQDNAVEAMALALINDGQPREKPFAAYTADTPGRIKNMALAAEAQAIHALVVSIRLDTSLAPVTLDAVQRAEQAAQNIEAALAPLAAQRNNLSAARQLRDKLAPIWDDNLAVLRRGVAAAADTGAAALGTALFGPRRSVKKAKSAATEAAATSSPPAPTSMPPAVATTPPAAATVGG